MLCESQMRWRCHSSQLFMEKFQSVCTLAGEREGRTERKVQNELYRAERWEVGREWRRAAVNAALKERWRQQVNCWVAAVFDRTLHPQPLLLFAVEVCRGHGMAPPSGLKSILFILPNITKISFASSKEPEVMNCFLCTMYFELFFWDFKYRHQLLQKKN